MSEQCKQTARTTARTTERVVNVLGWTVAGVSTVVALASGLLFVNGEPDGYELTMWNNETIKLTEKTLANIGIPASCTPPLWACFYVAKEGVKWLVGRSERCCSLFSSAPRGERDNYTPLAGA